MMNLLFSERQRFQNVLGSLRKQILPIESLICFDCFDACNLLTDVLYLAQRAK